MPPDTIRFIVLWRMIVRFVTIYQILLLAVFTIYSNVGLILSNGLENTF